ncbi:methionyl-tRNA formyltransferase [Rufibacter sediminis]|uniref:Methionyl-tRNA formyltransferase n=1 Tax=Rufibacter sediminis TaxID=2762756 RepID=A0ABR6VYV2_9BACT|nr:methionyl-tRNA formyltransferase [Rufibacter sediminis]MBC3542094.1 methionyl-tRNA formyltransferase [Rufibacter sediminis]
MRKEDLRIIFMGTPDFAVPALQALVENNWNVVAVVTAPDKPAGRGLKLVHSPVKEVALQHNLPILQPTNLKDPAFQEELRSYNASLQVIVAFRMLPEAVWNMPQLGSLNIHASLLPHYRGAAPINWALIHGDKETGVTSFFLQHEIDTGDIILQKKVAIAEEDTFGTLYEKLKHAGADLLLETVAAIVEDRVQPYPQPQPEEPLRMAPKIFKQTCQIDWEQPAQQIHNFIRGLSPYPAAWTILEDKQFKVFSGQILENGSKTEPGTYTTDGKTYLHITCGNGTAYAIEELQMEGKKRMNIQDFLRGFTFQQAI